MTRELKSDKQFEEVLSQNHFTSKFVLTPCEAGSAVRPRQLLTVLHSFLHVCVNEQYGHPEKVIGLLQQFNCFLGIRTLMTVHRQLIISAYVTLFDRTYLLQTGATILLYCETVCSFFSQPYIVPSSCFDMLSLLSKFVVKPNVSLLDEPSCQLLSCIDGLILQLGTRFPKQVLLTFMQLIGGAICALDTAALTFYSHMASVVDDPGVVAFVPMVPYGLISHIQSDPPFLKRIHSQKVVRLTPVNDGQLTSAFTKEIDWTNKIAFPQTRSYISLLREKFWARVQIVICVVTTTESLSQNFVEIMPTFIASVAESQHIIDILAVLHFIFRDIISCFPDLSLPLEAVVHPAIFDPAVTIFGENENWEEICTLRSQAMELVLHGRMIGIQLVLDQTMDHPLLFAEVVHRLLNRRQQSQLGLSDIPMLSQTLVSAMVYYQNVHPQDEEVKHAVATARLSIFHFLGSLFTDLTFVTAFYERPVFVACYLPMTSERPLRKFVLSSLQEYLVQKDSVKNDQVSGLILSMAKSAAQSGQVELLYDFLDVMDKAVRHVPQYCRIFSPIILEICTSCAHVAQSTAARELIMLLIQFMAAGADRRPISVTEISALESAIASLFDEPTPALFSRIVQLLAGQPLASLHPAFIIRNPKVLRLLMGVFLNRPMLIDTIGFVAKLCQFTIKNCEEAHRGEFDLYLISLLNKWRNDSNCAVQVIASTMSLLMLILSSASSVAVVQLFVGLLSPIDGKWFPLYQKLLVKSLNSMLTSGQQKPISTLPLSSNGSFGFHDLDASPFQDGLAFTFWIQIHTFEPRYQPRLFTLSDQRGITLGCHLAAGGITLSLQICDHEWSGRVDRDLELGKWSFFAAVLSEDRGSGQIQAISWLNDTACRTISFPMFRFNSATLQGSIGGTLKDLRTVEHPAVLSRFGLFPHLTVEDVEQLKDLGPCVASIQCLAPVCYFVPFERLGTISMRNTGSSSVTMKDKPLRYTRAMSFSEVLVTRCGASLLLPLFAQWDMKFSNGAKFDLFDATTLEILERALVLSEEGQTSFCQADGFKIMSHLLSSCNASHIDYNLYLKFAALFGEVAADCLRKQLVDAILLNVELWMRASAENHRRIVRHWSRVLLPTCIPLVIELRPFALLLTVLRVHYWYLPCENQLMERCRGEELCVKDCRQAILLVAREAVRARFTEDDFALLMSHILTCSDYEQVVDLLMFLDALICDTTSVLKNLSTSLHMIPLVQYLFSVKSYDVICTGLTLVVDTHNNGLIERMTLDDHIDIILHQIGPEFLSTQLFDHLIELTSQFPALFPICSWMAMNLGEQGVRHMLETIQPKESYNRNELWAVYCVVSLYEGDDKLRSCLSRFLLQCSPRSLSRLFATIDIIGRVLHQRSDPIKHILLFEYGKLVQDSDGILSVDDYLIAVRHFLLFSCDELENLALQEAFEDSPFYVREHRKPDFLDSPMDSSVTPPRLSRWKARHSLRPDSILVQGDDDRYSPALAQRALACLNPPRAIRQVRQSFRARRTSLMTLQGRRSSARMSASPEEGSVSLMPSRLDEKIREIAGQEFRFQFRLRRDGEGNWLDIDLAEQMLTIYMENPLAGHIENILIICGFLQHWRPELVRRILPKLQIRETGNGVTALFDRYSIPVGLCRISTLTASGIESESFALLQSIDSLASRVLSSAPLRFLKQIIRLHERNSATAFDIFGLISQEIITASTDLMADYSDRLGQLQRTNTKLWRRFWSCMTIERAPWHQSLPSCCVRQVHLKRDRVLCANGCPVRLRRNMNFDQHMDAVFLRESGCATTAQELFVHYQEEMAAVYSENGPAQLLEVVEDRPSLLPNSLSGQAMTQCIVELECEVCSVKDVRNATFTLLRDSILITMMDSGKLTVLKTNAISQLLLRTRSHRPTAIEIFMDDGMSYFVNFFNVNAMTVLKSFSQVGLPKIQLLQLSDFRSTFASTKFTEKWTTRRMSNFEYLIQLNILSGRSFNAPSQYPIMPWVLSDYVSATLDLTDPKVYRDLGLPMGATTPDRLRQLRSLVATCELTANRSFLYSTGPINPLNVYLYLIRLEPFTTLHIALQSGRFDHAARLFSSIASSFSSASLNVSEYLELIPEFFCSPEFLVNSDRFDFGSSSTGRVDDVVLPLWASSAIEFIYLHRKALESEQVSSNLHKWIDLVWGEKQRGAKAVAADNTFMPEMYDSVWNDEHSQDPITRAHIEAIQCHVGQIPAQLFATAHPRRCCQQSVTPIILTPLSVNLAHGRVITGFAKAIAQWHIRVSLVSATGTSIVATFEPPLIARMVRSTRPILTSDMVLVTRNVANFPDVTERTIGRVQDENAVVVRGAESDELHLVNLQRFVAEPLMRQRAEIVSLSVDGDWIATANRDSELLAFRLPDGLHPVFTIPVFTSSISCCAVSAGFHSVVIGT
jgi:hypothetical protein